ncbi:MAG: hypothetical protein WA324_10555 [Bryobacteraceae bacterium]
MILSYELWTTVFHSDPSILMRSITLGGVGRRVIGVMPARFVFPSSRIQVWMPARMDPSNIADYWGGEFVPLVGRLRLALPSFRCRPISPATPESHCWCFLPRSARSW